MIKRSSVSAAVLVVLGSVSAVTGCKDEAPPPTADHADASASAGLVADRPKIRKPMAPTARLDPHVMKAYRVDVCYFGTMTMAHTAAAYMKSLGGAEPSAGKIPDFGNPEPATPDAKGADPKADPKAPEDDPKAEQRRRALAARQGAVQQIPHERNARSCTVAAGLAEPAAADVDAALKEFAPFSIELAKDLTAAATYYQQKGFEKDEFKQGKELHAKLVEKFKKFDELHAKLGTAVAAWREAAPPPEDPRQPVKPVEGQPPEEKDEAAEKLSAEGRALGQAAFKEARAVIVSSLSGEPDAAKIKEGLEKVKTATGALKDFGTANATDTWSKMMVPALESFVTEFAAAADAGPIRKYDLKLITTATRMIEAHQRAVTRSIVARGRGMDVGPGRLGPGMPMHPGQPGPGAQPKDQAAPKEEAPAE